MKENNLRFIRNNQTEWRKEYYQGLQDHFDDRADRLGLKPSNLVILPSNV
jgi:hypothetical protein